MVVPFVWRYPPIEEALKRFSYNPETGEISSRKTGNVLTAKAGTTIQSIKIQLSHLAWALYYGEWSTAMLDHKDKNRRNNRIANLRKATDSQNGANKLLPSTSGFRGVSANKRSSVNPWMALIRIGGKQRYLGSFPTPELAHEAYRKAAITHHGEFAEFRTQNDI
jgi:hypothetical protein